MAYTAPTFTTTAIVNGNTKIQDVDEQVTQLITDVEDYVNDNLGEVANLAEGYKNDAETAKTIAVNAQIEAVNVKNDAVSARDDAVNAKNEIEGYVIPTEATYSPTTIKAIADMAETLNLTGAI